jgi:tyrosine-specific transport protein
MLYHYVINKEIKMTHTSQNTLHTEAARASTTLAPMLIIAGCCIGAGMIGLPVVSAQAGFLPSIVAMLLCYFFATSTGLLILEATLSFERPVNLITLAHTTLGKVGKYAMLGLFLFLFYCLFVAYIEGGGQLFSQLFTFLLGIPVGREAGILLCVGVVALSLSAGTEGVVKINRVFMVCICASYLTLVVLGLSHFNGAQLSYMNVAGITSVLPVLLVCFGYQNLVPTLTVYANRNVQTLKRAIYIGNLIPFGIYLLWNYVILGMLPETVSLIKDGNQAEMVADLLESVTQSGKVLVAVQVFSFFSILMPFIANALSFVDFLKDGFKALSRMRSVVVLLLFVLAPPTVLSLSYPHLFLKALSLVGGFADVLLFGVLPVAIVAVLRYRFKTDSTYRVPGGKFFLGLVLVASITLLLIRG